MYTCYGLYSIYIYVYMHMLDLPPTQHAIVANEGLGWVFSTKDVITLAVTIAGKGTNPMANPIYYIYIYVFKYMVDIPCIIV